MSASSPQPEEPFRGLPRPRHVARQDRQPQPQDLAAEHGLLVERLDRVDQRQGLDRLAPPGLQLGQPEAELDVPARRVEGPRQRGHGVFLVVVPPLDVTEGQQGIGPVGLGRRADRAPEVIDQVGGQVVTPVDFVCVPQDLDRRGVEIVVRSRVIDLDVHVLLAEPDRVIRLRESGAGQALRPGPAGDGLGRSDHRQVAIEDPGDVGMSPGVGPDAHEPGEQGRVVRPVDAGLARFQAVGLVLEGQQVVDVAPLGGEGHRRVDRAGALGLGQDLAVERVDQVVAPGPLQLSVELERQAVGDQVGLELAEVAVGGQGEVDRLGRQRRLPRRPRPGWPGR